MATNMFRRHRETVEDEHIPGTAIMRDHDGIRVQRGQGGQV